MLRAALVLAVVGSTAAFAADEPPGVLDRFLQKIRADLGKLPDFVCTQNVSRFTRTSPAKPWTKYDALRLQVALVGDQELYARAGERTFQPKPLIDMAGQGTITTGQFANFARHVFVTSTATFTFQGESEEGGRKAYQWSYDVPAAKSSYRLRTGTVESVVAFQGAFWVDPETLDILRLETQAYDIPDGLGLAQSDTALLYSRVAIDGMPVLLPVSATLNIVATDGLEAMNKTELSGCSHYRAETAIKFDPAPASGEIDRTAPAPVPKASRPEFTIPAGSTLEISLDSGLDPEKTAIGDEVRATITRPVRDGDTVLIPQGTVVSGRLVRVGRENVPFPTYEIALAFDTIQIAGKTHPLNATMVDAGPAPGLIRQKRKLDPDFIASKKRTNRIEVLVREVQQGQGILNWDARKGSVPQGFRMKWRVENAAAAR